MTVALYRVMVRGVAVGKLRLCGLTSCVARCRNVAVQELSGRNAVTVQPFEISAALTVCSNLSDRELIVQV